MTKYYIPDILPDKTIIEDDGTIIIGEEVLITEEDDIIVGKGSQLRILPGLKLNINEIKNYEKFDGSDLNKVKIILANEVTKNCHGENEAKNAEREANKILVKKSLDLETISKCENKIILNENQTINISVKQALVELKLCNSNSEAKKLIIQGAVKLNDKTVTDKDFLVNNDCFINNEIKYVVIYVGKKKYGVIQLIS